MRKLLTVFAVIFLLAATNIRAAMFEASPQPLQNSSSNVVITFHADQSGVTGLMNLNTDLYAHIGVYTNLNSNSWNYVKTEWSENTSANCFKRVSANTFELTIGNLRSYFGITNANEVITKICIIARNAAGSSQTSDQFIDVAEDGFALTFTSNPAATVIQSSTSFTFTASCSQSAKLTIQVDGKTVKEASNATSLTYSKTFSTPGAQNEVKAIATKGSETLEETISIFYLSNSAQGNYPGGIPKQGAVKNSDGSVTFCIAAPGKKSVVLVGSWDDYQALDKNTMKYQDYNGYRYFWTTVTGLDNSTYYPYYYLVDGKYKVSDPYAKLVLDNYSDKWLNDNVFPDRPRYPYDKFDDTMLAVYKGDMDDYDWKVNNFSVKKPIAYNKREALVIYELLFRDFTGSSGMNDGTVRAAIEKIPYLHELGVTAIEIMPIMQFDGNSSWGYNTTSYMAPDKSYGSPDDYREFIDKCHELGIAVILDIAFNHTTNNHPWYQMYDRGTSPFYNASCPHDYGVHEDIKQEYPLVEQHWIDVLTYWMTAYKVDGFRFDLVKGLGDSDSYSSGTEAYNQSRIDRMKRLHAAMKKVNPNVIHINENLAGSVEETPMGLDGQLQWNNQSGSSASFCSGNAASLRYYLSSACSRPKHSTVDYAESHDEERMGFHAASWNSSAATRRKRLGSMAAQLLLTPGPKMIWQFGELGAEQTTKLSNGENDTDPKNVLWDLLDESKAANKSVIDLKNNYAALNNLRRCNPELFVEENFKYNESPRYMILNNGVKEVVLAVNTGTSKASITIPAKLISDTNNKLITASYGYSDPSIVASANNIQIKDIPAHSFAVFATPNISDIYNVGEGEIEMGDVNGDGAITVIDATMTLSYVLGIQPVGFQKQAADLDGNGRVSINDITTIISVILNRSRMQVAAAKVAQLQKDGIEALRINPVAGESAATIAIANSSRYVAMQMDIEMPDGAELKDLRLCGNNALTHNLFAERIDATTVRVVAISMNNQPFADDEILTVELDLDGSIADAEVTVRGCRAVMADGALFTEMSLNDASGAINPETSSIVSATAAKMNITAEGRTLKVTTSTNAVVTVCNIAGIVRSYEVAAGTTRIELATPGVYIVNNQKFIIK